MVFSVLSDQFYFPRLLALFQAKTRRYSSLFLCLYLRMCLVSKYPVILHRSQMPFSKMLLVSRLTAARLAGNFHESVFQQRFSSFQ